MKSLPGYVYAMKARHGGIKVGCTTDVGRRHIDLNRNRDIGLIVLATAFSPNYLQAERWAHLLLKPYRIAGEWFSCPDELAIEAIRRVGAPQ